MACVNSPSINKACYKTFKPDLESIQWFLWISRKDYFIPLKVESSVLHLAYHKAKDKKVFLMLFPPIRDAIWGKLVWI